MMDELKMLLWKDYRLSRICILAGIIFINVPYLFYFFPHIEWNINVAWPTSAFISQLTMTLLAGNIIACERVDRSATFLAYQGASRNMVVASKLIICATAFVSICAIHFVLSFWLKIDPHKLNDYRIIGILIAATGFCFFGCCWLLSALSSSSVVSIVFGLLPPMFIGFTLGMSCRYFKWPHDNIELPFWYIAINFVTGLLSLVAGTWYFIRSKES